MKTIFRTTGLNVATVAALGMIVMLNLTGCSVFFAGSSSGPLTKTPPTAVNENESLLRAGDPLSIRVETTPNMLPQQSEVTVDDRGDIALPLIGRIKAEGITTTQLAEKIQLAYVPRYYVRCTATVLAPTRFFYIGGEVRSPSRIPWSKDMSLLKAISTAGGYTDFSNRNKVEIARGRTKLIYDCEDIRRHPEKDIAIQPGDSIYVPRTIL